IGFRHPTCIALGASCFLIGTALAASGSGSLPADLILSGSEIYVPGGWAQSVAIKDGVIIAVGDDAATAQHKTSSTRVIDLEGATAVPGLHDMHVHPMLSGLQAEYACTFAQGSNARRVLETARACVAKRSKG